MSKFEKVVEFGFNPDELEDADCMLRELGIRRPDYLRAALRYVAEKGRVPFEVTAHKRKRRPVSVPSPDSMQDE